MSVIVNICGMLIATSNFPDTTLQQFYQQYYHCKIERSYDWVRNMDAVID